MASVYQCVRCKGLFKDITAVSTHQCRSLIQSNNLPNSSQDKNRALSSNQSKNSNINSNTSAERKSADHQSQVEITTSQQTDKSAGNVGSTNLEEQSTHSQGQSMENSSPCTFLVK